DLRGREHGLVVEQGDRVGVERVAVNGAVELRLCLLCGAKRRDGGRAESAEWRELAVRSESRDGRVVEHQDVGKIPGGGFGGDGRQVRVPAIDYVLPLDGDPRVCLLEV